MARTVVSKLVRQPVVVFYLLAFGITWLGWLPQTLHSRGFFPIDSPLFYIVGGVGPLIAAYVVLRRERGGDAVGVLFAPLLRWRVRGAWYPVALLGYPLLWLVAVTLNGDVGGARTSIAPLSAVLELFLISFLAAIPEEVAQRGFALPRLQRPYGALAASLLVGALWALWHLPLLLNLDSPMSTYPLVPFLLTVVARSVIYTWIINSSGGSVLLVTLFHAASNTVGTFVPAELLVTGVLALLIVIRCRSTWLNSDRAPTRVGAES